LGIRRYESLKTKPGAGGAKKRAQKSQKEERNTCQRRNNGKQDKIVEGKLEGFQGSKRLPTKNVRTRKGCPRSDVDAELLRRRLRREKKFAKRQCRTMRKQQNRMRVLSVQGEKTRRNAHAYHSRHRRGGVDSSKRKRGAKRP